MSDTSRVSVVVGLISGKVGDLRLCLRSLHSQSVAPPLEILVPYDDPCADVLSLQEEFPAVKFLRAVGLDTRAARAGASREHHDTLRTIGLRAATSAIVALTEDHAHTAHTWCEEILMAFDRHANAAAVGGAVDCDSERMLNWAVWYCDFGRYQSPLPDQVAEFVSDSNVAYRRDTLQRVEAAWRNDYHETAVHWAMTEAGFELRTAPRMQVWQSRSALSFGAAIRERFVWARSFAGTRARMSPGAKRWIWAVASPMLPILMTLRLVRTASQRGRFNSRLVSSLPLIVVLQFFWALGELIGYVTADPG